MIYRVIFMCLLICTAIVNTAFAEEVKETQQKSDKQSINTVYDLPAYGEQDVLMVGEMAQHFVGPQDTLHDIARHYGLGFIELRAANPGVDSWAPRPETSLIIPGQHLLPRAPQDGIVINLAEMRLYYFKDGLGKPPLTYPLGIGRDGLETPLGDTTIVRRATNPNWYPTDRMKEENPNLPWKVEPGPANPLGTHALYLGWPTFLIHGTNKPWGIGRKVSSGCIRMYPKDIITLFDHAGDGTKVTVVDQPFKVATLGDALYIEVNPTSSEISDIEIDGTFFDAGADIPDALIKVVEKEVEGHDITIDWEAFKTAFQEKHGYPVKVSKVDVENVSVQTKKRSQRPKHRYN